MDERPTLLVVDDEKRNVTLLEALLIPQGYEVITAENGEQALERLTEHDIDVVLLDVMMPGMDGFEVAQRIRMQKQFKALPIVMVTALQDTDSRVKALEVGADDFLSKPVDKTELRARVRSLVKVKAYHDQQQRYQVELEETVAARTAQLSNALEENKLASVETIQRLSRAAEYKDDDTGIHVQRMSHYAAIIAREMGLAERHAESILFAAPMHDVGKIGIPDRILLKPGKLDPDEWKIMQQHVDFGVKILQGSRFEIVRLAEIIAATHHERWDGTGYPNRLEGEDIHQVGRIVAVADVFDALASKRPYKDAFPLDKCFDILRESSGGHFDPAVVDAFFAAEDKILAVKERLTKAGSSPLFELAQDPE